MRHVFVFCVVWLCGAICSCAKKGPVPQNQTSESIAKPSVENAPKGVVEPTEIVFSSSQLYENSVIAAAIPVMPQIVDEYDQFHGTPGKAAFQLGDDQLTISWEVPKTKIGELEINPLSAHPEWANQTGASVRIQHQESIDQSRMPSGVKQLSSSDYFVTDKVGSAGLFLCNTGMLVTIQSQTKSLRRSVEMRDAVGRSLQCRTGLPTEMSWPYAQLDASFGIVMVAARRLALTSQNGTVVDMSVADATIDLSEGDAELIGAVAKATAIEIAKFTDKTSVAGPFGLVEIRHYVVKSNGTQAALRVLACNANTYILSEVNSKDRKAKQSGEWIARFRCPKEGDIPVATRKTSCELGMKQWCLK